MNFINSMFRRLKQIFGFGPSHNLLAERPEYARYDIGRWSYGDLKIVAWGKDENLKIGKFCSFAENTKILLGGEHVTTNITTFPVGYFIGGASNGAHARSKGDVIIGNDVWVATNAMILSGVKIGHGAVIGANSLVTKDVPDYAIVAGNPATLIRMRFSPDEIKALLEIKWWDWPDEKIRENAAALMSSDKAAFIKQMKKNIG
jgi:acetyltransferase-like isoleucine patch superfamily enzyme